MIPWNGPENVQYTPSFNLQIPVYFDVGINVAYLKQFAARIRKTRTHKSGRRFRGRQFPGGTEPVNLAL